MKLNSDYKIINNNDNFLLYNSSANRYYEIDQETYHFIDKISKNQLLEIKDEEIEVYAFLCKKGIIEDKNIPQEEFIKKSNELEKFVIFSFDVNRFFDKHPSIINFFGSKYAHWIGRIITICSFILMVTILFSQEILSGILYRFQWTDIVIILFTYILLVFVHETSHAILCKIETGHVGECGCMLYFLIPTFYTDVTIIRTVEYKKKKKVILAGVYSQLLLNAILSILLLLVDSNNSSIYNAFEYIFITNLILIIANLIPFLKFDGYWLLSSYLNRDQLYEKSISLVFKGRKNQVEIGTKVMWAYGIVLIFFYITAWGLSALYIFNSIVQLNYIIAILTVIILGFIVLFDIGKKIKKYRNYTIQDKKL